MIFVESCEKYLVGWSDSAVLTGMGAFKPSGKYLVKRRLEDVFLRPMSNIILIMFQFA